MKIIGANKILSITIHEDYVPITDPLCCGWRMLDGPPYKHIIWTGDRSDPFELASAYCIEPAPEGYLESSPSFSDTLYHYCTYHKAPPTRQGLVFLCTFYLVLKGKINLLDLMNSYDPEKVTDPVEKLFTGTFGHLVFESQLIDLYKTAYPGNTRIMPDGLLGFNGSSEDPRNADMLRLMLPNKMTIKETMEKYMLMDRLLLPNWEMADTTILILKWYELW